MKKRLISLVLAALLVLCLLPATAYAATTASGACGKNLTWSLSSTGTLTISGKGAMAEYSNGNMPWAAYKNQIKSVVLSKGVTTIAYLSFSDCGKLTSVQIPDSVTDIGAAAFNKCTALSDMTLPRNLKTLGWLAFAGCSSLRSLRIPASVSKIGMYPARSCTGLQAITVASGNKNFVSRDGALYTKDMKTLIQYPGGRTGGIVIPQGVETLSMDSLGCPGMTSILLPVSLKLIGTGAFYGCDNLTDVYYAGTEKQWALVEKGSVEKGSMNEALGQAKMHYNYKRALPPVTAEAKCIVSTGKPYIKWTAVTGASKYEVYRATSKTGTYKLLGTTASLSYTDNKAGAGYTYYYKVKAVNAAGSKSDYSAVVTGICRCARPVVKTSYAASTGRPYIKWDAVAGAVRYEVYRAASKNGTYTLLGTTAATHYTDKKASTGCTYYYKVKAVSKVKASANSYYSAAAAGICHCAKPSVNVTATSAGKPRLTWNAVAGAGQYEVYRATSQNGAYTKMYTTTGLSYTNTSAKAGTTYYYKVKAISKVTSTANSAFSTPVSIKAK